MVRRAFTLVELLVVITILGILVGITVPAIVSVTRGKEQHVVQPIQVSTPERGDTLSGQEIPIEKSEQNRYYVRIEGRRFLIILRDGKPEIHPCD